MTFVVIMVHDTHHVYIYIENILQNIIYRVNVPVFGQLVRLSDKSV